MRGDAMRCGAEAASLRAETIDAGPRCEIGQVDLVHLSAAHPFHPTKTKMASIRLPMQSFLRAPALHSFPAPSLLRARPTPLLRSLCTSTPTKTPQAGAFLRQYRLSLALALPTLALSGLLLFPAASQPSLQCEGVVVGEPLAAGGAPRARAESMVSVNELSFGTVAGICVGVFVKKGLKVRLLLLPPSRDAPPWLTSPPLARSLAQFLAFGFGGLFVLLQYLNSRSFITLNWKAMTSSYDKLLDTHSAPSSPTSYSSAVANKGGTAGRVAGRFVDFVTADVQGRATFVLGMALGFRLG